MRDIIKDYGKSETEKRERGVLDEYAEMCRYQNERQRKNNEDFSDEEDSYEILTNPDAFSEVREALEKEGIKMANAEVTMIPQNYVTLTDEEAIKKMNIIIDRLDEDEDVQQVYHNWDE